MTDLDRWLGGLGLEQYAAAFAENAIDTGMLAALTAEDLKEIGVAALGHRKRLLEAIAALRETGGTPAIASPSLAVTATPAGAERRQLTVMFVDLVGSTALSARLDPEEMGGVLRGYQNAVAGEVARFEGHVAKFMGDGVLAYFGWPVAHEDEAERAVRAGLAIVAAVTRLSGGEAPLACRIGLATGLVVVGELIGEGTAQEQTVVGDTPNLAARLQALAAPGQVVVAEATRRLLGAGFLLDDLGAQALKGIAGAVGAFAVGGERVLASRFEGRATGLQPMVGRDQELALLLERWQQAEAGEGQAVLLVGEAGVGKSRISRALLDALGPEPHTRIRYQCSPYHTGSALWPAIQQLEHAARFAAGDSLETRLDKLEAALGSGLLGGGASGEATALIAGLVGIDGSARYGALELAPAVLRARTLEALVRQLLKLAATRPVLLLVEDAHWADPTTLELIEAWLDAIATARVLLVLTSRPDNQPALAAHPHVTRLSLNRLGRAGVEAIVARLGGNRLPPATIDAIIARTDGVPLYVEELTKAVLETGEAAIPASLHDSLMARLDRTPEVKEIAQIAACIGREFDHALLAAVADRPPVELTNALDKLATAELVFRRGTPPDACYTFKHALVRDAAYESLLKSRRQALHRRILDALESAGAAAELLAQHAQAAGLVERAIGHWQLAGGQAIARSATAEAIGHLMNGLELIGGLADTTERRQSELALLSALAPALMAGKGYAASEVAPTLARARELCLQDSDDAALFPVLWQTWLVHLTRAEHPLAEELARECLALAEASADDALLIESEAAVGLSAFYRGRPADGERYLERCEARYDPARHGQLSRRHAGIDPAAAAMGYRAWVLWLRGYPERGASVAGRMMTLAEELGQPYTLARGLYWSALFHHLRRDWVTTVEQAEAMIRIADENGFAMVSALGPILRASAQIEQGGDEQPIAALVAGIDRYTRTGARMQQPHLMAMLARAHLKLGRPSEGLEVLAAATKLAEQTGERYLLADLHRQRAECLLAGPRPDATAAVEALGQALAIAREQEARSLELRAARDLARLWAERGERQRALDLLGPIHGWFTEGFDTPDLVEAKALLEALG
jgi:class 3 adenylate cyclase/predicted ATPase